MSRLKREAHLMGGGKRQETVHPQPHVVGEVELRHRKLHLPLLYPPQVEYLADKPLQQGGVAPDHSQHVALARSEVAVVEDALHGVGYKRQRGAQVVAHVGEERQLGVGRLALHAPLHYGHAVKRGQHHGHKYEYDDAQYEVNFLVAVLCEEEVYAPVQLFQLAAEVAHFLRLHQHRLGVVSRYESRLHVIVTLVRLAFKYVEGQVHDEVAAGGVDV